MPRFMTLQRPVVTTGRTELNAPTVPYYANVAVAPFETGVAAAAVRTGIRRRVP